MSDTTQLIEALAMIEYWRTECEQQRTRAEAAEQELRAEKQRGNSAWGDGYAKSLARAKAVEARLAAATRHRDDLLASIKRDCETMAATGVKETLLRDAIPVLAQQRDEARARLAAILVVKEDLRCGGEADGPALAKKLDTTANAVRVARSKARKTIAKELGKLGHDLGGAA